MNIFKKKKTKYYVLSLGHLCADMNQGMLSAVLPFLVAAYNYDYTTAATLVMVSNILGSVIQPVFGYIADKKHDPKMMILGILLAGGGMALTGVLTSFVGLCVAVVISGIGVAMFHPQGAQLVNKTSDANNKATNMGIFSFGGNFGFTVGPLLATAAIGLFGLPGTLAFIIPSVIFGAVSQLTFGDLEIDDNSGSTGSTDAIEKLEDAPPKDMWGAFAKLVVLISVRSIIFSGVNTFLVLYLIDAYGKSKGLGNGLLSMYYAIAAFSSLYGGRLADRIGIHRTIRLSYLILLPGMALFALADSFPIEAAMLIPMGMGISICYSPQVLLGQQYLPNRTGLASGVMLGLSVSVGGVIAPLLGMVGDAYGLETTFAVVAALSMVPVILAFLLDEPEV